MGQQKKWMLAGLVLLLCAALSFPVWATKEELADAKNKMTALEQELLRGSYVRKRQSRAGQRLHFHKRSCPSGAENPGIRHPASSDTSEHACA